MSDETFVGSGGAVEPASVAIAASAGDKTEFIVGRDAGCDVVVADPRVSRHHARLRVTPGGLWVKDLNSRAGVKVNGQRIEGSVRLRLGDELTLGGATLRTTDEPLKTLLVRAEEMAALNTGPTALPPGGERRKALKRSRPSAGRVLAAAMSVAIVAAAATVVLMMKQPPRSHDFQAAFSSVFMIVAEAEGRGMMPLGTGFVVEGQPYIVTNQHVAEALTHACNMAPNCHGLALRNEAPAEKFQVTDILAHPQAMGGDPLYRPDVALLRVAGADKLPKGIPLAAPGTLVPDTLRGEQVAIISFPGETMDVNNPIATIDFGTVGRVTNGLYIQHSANMTPGSSGSPLLVSGPRVIGVNFAALGLKPVMAMNNQTQQMGVERIATAGGLNLAVSALSLRELLSLGGGQ